MSSYTVRRVKIGTRPLLDALALECGRLYSLTLVWFWRIVRRRGIWLSSAAMMHWLNSDRLHAHTADACVQAFFASLESWRVRRKVDPEAQPPKRRRRYFRIEYSGARSRRRHHPNMPCLQTQAQAVRQGVPVSLRVSIPPRRCRVLEHPAKVSGLRSSSWGDGVPRWSEIQPSSPV